jgi:hypothetical protein
MPNGEEDTSVHAPTVRTMRMLTLHVLVFGEQGIAHSRQQHHAHEDGHEGAARHRGGGGGVDMGDSGGSGVGGRRDESGEEMQGGYRCRCRCERDETLS